MNCAWCGANADDSDSHGVCQNCADALVLQSLQRQFDRISSYVETNAAALAQECDAVLRQQAVGTLYPILC